MTATKTNAPKFSTREAWLNALSAEFAPLFSAAGFPLPERIRLTMSLTGKSKVVGLCYSTSASRDAHFEILVRIDQDDPVVVAGILAHELAHAAVGLAEGHKGAFVKCFRAIGLEGKATECRPSEAFVATLGPIFERLGAFPHAALAFGLSSGPKKQGTRMLKVSCAECGFTVRQTAKWVAEVGCAHCPEHGEMQLEGAE